MRPFLIGLTFVVAILFMEIGFGRELDGVSYFIGALAAVLFDPPSKRRQE